MARGTKSPHMVIYTSTLLLVASLLAGTFHTAAAITSTDTTPPADSPPSSSPSPDDSLTPDSSDSDDSTFLKYKVSDDTDVIGTYNIIWNTETTFSASKCHIRGFYDDTVLKTEQLIDNCFSELSNNIETGYNLGHIYDADTYYIPSIDYPYCAVKCFSITDSAASKVTSMQMSFVSIAFASMVFLTLNHF